MTLEELNTFRDEDLFSIARNPSAHQKDAAVRILVERGSHLARHDDLVAAASEMIYSEPKVLAKADPAMAQTIHKLPGLLDVVSAGLDRVSGLERHASNLASELREAAGKHQDLWAELVKESDSRTRAIEALETLVKTSAEEISAQIDRLSAAFNQESTLLRQDLEDLDGRLKRTEQGRTTRFLSWVKSLFK